MSEYPKQKQPDTLYRLLIGGTDRHGAPVSRASHERNARMIERAFPDGSTTYHAQGVWKGKHELTIVVEAYALGTTKQDSIAQGLAEMIAEQNEQEAVALAILRPVRFLLIGDGGAIS